MSTWIATLAAMLVISTTGMAVADGAAQSPQAMPTATAAPCATPTTITPDEAFAHAIDDPRTLAFISYVEGIPEADRGKIRPVIPMSRAETAEVDRATADPCIDSEIAHRTARLLYSLAKRWNTQDANNLEPAVRFAMATLLPSDQISVPTRAVALANFLTTEDKLDAMISAAQQPPPPTDSSATCPPDVIARATHIAHPEYQAKSLEMRVTAVISVKIALDSHGFVRSATMYHNTINSGSNDDDLVSETIVSAGSSDYAPEFEACKAVAGAYIFRSEFDGRREL